MKTKKILYDGTIYEMEETESHKILKRTNKGFNIIVKYTKNEEIHNQTIARIKKFFNQEE